MVQVFVFKRPSPAPQDAQLLQIRRTRNPFVNTWQICAGGIHPHEQAVDAARRELIEELALDTGSDACVGFYRLDTVVPFYMPRTKIGTEAIFFAPAFAAEVRSDWQPTLNTEHDAHRWVRLPDAPTQFMWPGQLALIHELETVLLRPSLAQEHLRL